MLAMMLPVMLVAVADDADVAERIASIPYFHCRLWSDGVGGGNNAWPHVDDGLSGRVLKLIVEYWNLIPTNTPSIESVERGFL